MIFSIKKFQDLTPEEVHEIYALRSAVFVVEQRCAYLDPDKHDLTAHHVLLIDKKVLVGYARILPPGAVYDDPAIGRVVVKKEYRGKSLGKKLMEYTLHQTLLVFQKQQIVISAQVYLLDFYSALGFKTNGRQYLEDDIPHIQMSYTSEK